MTQIEIEILVTDCGREIQRWPCRPTEMPDGAPGVMWRGVAYPLLPGDRIDVGAAQPLAPAPSGHAIINGEDDSWVLIGGLEATMLAARKTLILNGIEVLRAGRWLGEPVDGIAFDWFICCAGLIPPGKIDSVLGRAVAPEVEDTTVRAEQLAQKLLLAQAEISGLEASLRARTAPDAAMAAEIARLQGELGDAQAVITALHANLDEARQTVPEPAPPVVPRRLEDELVRAFRALRPDIQLLRNSLLVALGEYESLAGFWQTVGELPISGARPESWKKVQAAERWWERHVSTGRDNSGRAYARFDSEARIWQLLLSFKGSQQRDLNWLRQQV